MQFGRKQWVVLLAGLVLPVATSAADTTRNPAVPGTVNYVEGQVSLNGKSLGANAVGSVVDPGQSISTANGKVEVLLTPGVFFRLGDRSSAGMITADLTNTEVELHTGRALLEVAELHPENILRVKEGGLTARIEKTGLYEFDLDGGSFRVFEGKAEVQTPSRQVTVNSGHELLIGGGKLTAKKFDPKEYEGDDLYNWSSLRSSYLAEANVNEASYYEEYGGVPGGPFWWGAGWYWNPWFGAYTFCPRDGIFFSPFGWGFYSPWSVYRAPYYGYGYGDGHMNVYHHFSMNPATWGPGEHYATSQHYAKGTYNGPGTMGGAFHSGGRFTGSGFGGSRGGGVHGGGFHSAFSGAFHGGGGGGSGGHGR